MFDSNSRYAKLEIKTYEMPDPDRPGETRAIRYIQRRFLTEAGTSVTLVEHTVEEGDRLDNLTTKYLGDPLQFWRVADSNETLRPEGLTDEPGQRVKITLPQ